MRELNLQNKKTIFAEKGRRAFWLFALLLALQIGGYGYLVNASVGRVVSRLNYEQMKETLSSQVATLEVSYFELQKKLTIEAAAALDYANTTRVEYVDKNGVPVAILSRGN